MKTEIAEKIRKFIVKKDTDVRENYTVIGYWKNFTILMNNETHLHTFIVNGDAYQEQLKVHPIFSFEEIEEALTQF